MFQSSPARGGGCNGVLFGGTPRFKSVSILTRSWGRVQPKQVLTTVIEATFQSSPARGGGCNNGRAQRDALDLLVSILTRPWGRVQLDIVADGGVSHDEVSILTRPWGRVQPRAAPRIRDRLQVSILTRPWGRVQRQLQALDNLSVRRVSILTRPWGRVQLERDGRLLLGIDVSILTRRGGGCNGRWFESNTAHPSVFQSSPARGGGCNEVSTGGTAPRWARFNPHPPVGAGATRTDGTNPPDENVSILTRPWGRVQRGANCCRCATATCFNPHPPVGAGATWLWK